MARHAAGGGRAVVSYARDVRGTGRPFDTGDVRIKARGPEHVPGGLAVGLEEAGAEHIHRTDAAHILLYMQSSMAVGKVLDAGGKAENVDRLFVANHAAPANGVGGADPTHTGQALALRTAEHVAARYFGGLEEPIGDVP